MMAEVEQRKVRTEYPEGSGSTASIVPSGFHSDNAQQTSECNSRCKVGEKREDFR
jgi:hypothetical protein